MYLNLERKASDENDRSKEEDWELKDVVFVEDKKNSSIGVVLKVLKRYKCTSAIVKEVLLERKLLIFSIFCRLMVCMQLCYLLQKKNPQYPHLLSLIPCHSSEAVVWCAKTNFR